jgi:hypothetical protein
VILGAGLLLLVGLGLLVGGALTGVTALYWGCVAACLVAAVLLVLVRRQMAAERGGAERVVAERGAAARSEQRTPDRPPPADEPAPEPGRPAGGEPPLEEVEVTDLLLVMDLRDEVLVVDEHPRYHLSGCPHLAGADTFPLPIDEARSDGFTPCGTCSPDRNLAQRARERRAGRP